MSLFIDEDFSSRTRLRNGLNFALDRFCDGSIHINYFRLEFNYFIIFIQSHLAHRTPLLVAGADADTAASVANANAKPMNHHRHSHITLAGRKNIS